ncbi:nuclease-related domain-containing DEAD/DEAH box helicase [Hydrogenophaga palleronii]|uniref:nuclease-related domain-containing DEAD/DEAH box helicase n=1 Tax=Hydrogenophaga palleronii TaxID=65655 RepID=UPI000824DA18|nr:UvrD-helicase domain-containing protein [Hydrogenophaga palleronii]
MAQVIPPFEDIAKFRQPATPGELHLLHWLEAQLDAGTQVFFQPCINGDRPDIVLMHRERGLLIVEVKDWDLVQYCVDADNRWSLRHGAHPYALRSPAAQAFHYKQTFFKLHVNGLLERAAKDKRFYGLIHVLVYLHGPNRDAVEHFYAPARGVLRQQLADNALAFREKRIPHVEFERRLEALNRKRNRLDRDMKMTVTADQLCWKMRFPDRVPSELFTDDIHAEFLRLLMPPFHYAHQGREIAYTPRQAALGQSLPGHAKIRGLAGSGKTTVLARRAVSAHARHGGDVLLLTFNLTLRMYVHDRISEVRSDFSWSRFQILHYHGFITGVLGNAGVDVLPPLRESPDVWYEREYYSNIGLFREIFASQEADQPKAKGRHRYRTILVDEIQDYRPAWVQILQEFFLEEGGELVLFGDERQNIYNRPVDEERKVRLPDGYGRWLTLNKSFRYRADSHILALASNFQREFLAQRYDWEADAAYQPALSLVGVNAFQGFVDGDHATLAAQVIRLAQQERIHPNDLTVIASQKEELREIDYQVRKGPRHREHTLTTFASRELMELVEVLREAQVWGISAHRELDQERLRDFPGGLEAARGLQRALEPVSRMFKSLQHALETVHAVEKQKKYAFNLNSGVMKLSTTHSFKGFESPTVVLLVGARDSAELVYTGLTRARENIVVYVHAESPFHCFFAKRLEPLERLLQAAETGG